MGMKKRGVSAVVATILIILLVIVGVSILWAAVRPTLEKTTEQISADCITLDLEITGCDPSAGVETITVKRNIGEGDLGGIKLIVDDVPCDTNPITLDVLETNSTQQCIRDDDVIGLIGGEDGSSVKIAAVLTGGQLCAPLRNPFTCL